MAEVVVSRHEYDYWSFLSQITQGGGDSNLTVCERVGHVALGVLKFLSYITLVIPLAVWLFSQCQGDDVNESSQKADGAGRGAIQPELPGQRISVQAVDGLSTESLESGYIEHLNNLLSLRDVNPKKRAFLQGAITRYNEFNLSQIESPIIYRFDETNTGRFVINRALRVRDGYLLGSMENHTPAFRHTPDFFDYSSSSTSRSKHFYVDFANRFLGGGCFGSGMVQEEKMALEIPGLAAIVAKGIMENNGYRTRSGGAHQGQGDPTPILITGLHRVMEIQRAIYGGRAMNNLDVNAIPRVIYNLPNAQEVNILAVAAPNLPNYGCQFLSVTGIDLFNTIYAGFTLAKMNASAEGKRATIHSGKIGCGAFNNNPALVYLLHKYVAQKLDVDVVMHGCRDEEVEQFESIWNTIAGRLNGEETLVEGVQVIVNLCETGIA